MKKFLALIVVFLGDFAVAHGQKPILDKINEIKAQTDIYMWDEYTHPNPDTAKINAARWMLIEVNLNREYKYSVEDVLPYMKYIQMKRGNLTRAFAYMKRSDLPSAPSMGRSSNYASPLQQDDTGVQITYEQPSYTAQQLSSEYQSAPAVSFSQPDAFVREILQHKQFMEVYDFLKHERIEGRLAQYGALKDVEDYSSMNLILFDMQSREAISVLSGETSKNKRINLITGAEDSLDNYPQDMLLVIWYIK